MAKINAIPGSTAMLIGEGPHWIEKDQSLILVDIAGGYFLRHYTETGRLQKMKLDDLMLGSYTSLIIPVEGTADEFLVSVGKTLAWVQWSSSDPDHVLRRPIPLFTVDKTENNRFNDGKCDPQGRLWAGTMAYETSPAVLPLEKGALYRIDKCFGHTKIADKISISNGLAWSGDGTKFYYIDSLAYSVDVFDYDDQTGSVGNRRVLFDYKSAGLTVDIPDGMTIDAHGNLWVACFKGAKVICIDTTVGKMMRQIQIPSLNTTSCCWGGKDYSTLYVTSGSLSLSQSDFEKRPDSGKTFAVTELGVKGLPPNNFSMDKESLANIKRKL